MDHVAILRKARISKGDDLLGDILKGQKTIESRWYKHKIAPWDRIQFGDTIYFKESGQPVTARATVSRVLAYDQLDQGKIEKIIREYGSQIAPHSTQKELDNWARELAGKNYCLLIFLNKVISLPPFRINKAGFGSAVAWLVTNNIDQLKEA